MPKTEAYVAGRQVTVDNQQFDVKFTKTVKQLEAGLSKAQKARTQDEGSSSGALREPAD